MKLITISGLDGSGKSTQIELLKTFLQSQGKKVFYFHAVQFSLANKLSGKNGNDGRKSVTNANKFQIFLRRIFFMIDLIRFRSLYKKLEDAGYDYILSDRYFYDTVVNINFLRNSQKKMPCEKNIQKPDIAIYLQADPEQIMQRERKPDQGISYLEKKQALFNQKISEWQLKAINGNRDKNTIFEEIKALAT